MEDYEDYEEFLDHLKTATDASQKAYDCLYKRDGVKRSTAYKLRLGNAQSALMTLLMREINHKENKKTGGAHEWECLGGAAGWEIHQCVYCSRTATPAFLGYAFWPDVLRYIPFLGKKWRCPG